MRSAVRVGHDALGQGLSVPASSTRSVGAGGVVVVVVVGVSAVVFVGGASATGNLGVAFSLTLVARYACLPCPLALVACRGHGLEARAVLGSGDWI